MPDQPLSVVLTVPAAPLPVGQPVPVAVEVRNMSTQPLWMVGVLDGSEAGFRYPHYLPEITGPDMPPPGVVMACGILAPLRLQEFRRLAPGESFDPTAPESGAAYMPLTTFTEFRPPAPGRYELRLTLSTQSQQDEEWLGTLPVPDREAVLARLSHVPRVQITSNTAAVTVSG